MTCLAFENRAHLQSIKSAHPLLIAGVAMLRTMREGSEKHPWILWSILIAITVTFVIVGAWDYEGSPTNTVAESRTV